MSRIRLAIVCTHPIQYFAPLFQRLAGGETFDVHVFYGWDVLTRPTLDPGFGQVVRWDVPLLDGYPHSFVPNRSRDPGPHRFSGIDCPDLVPRIRAWRPDAVLVFGWAYQSHLAVLRAFQGRVPIFFRGDSTLLGERSGLGRLARWAVLRWVYRHVDMALYVGQRNRDYFRRYGLRDHQLAWVPHAVDVHRFQGPDENDFAAEAARRRFAEGIPSGSPTVLFAGKLEKRKAPDVLLKAFQAVAEAGSRLVYVGSGPLEPYLRSQASTDPRVHILGFENQSYMPVVYRLGDIFVLPSREETWGLAVNEAMSCGRPIIVSDQVGCAPDLVHPGKNGSIVPADDEAALGAALDQLLRDPSLRHSMGEASTEIIQEWSIEHAATRIEEAVCGFVQPSPSNSLTSQSRG